VWDFYRGQAEAVFPDDVIKLLEENGVERYSAETTSAPLRWTNAINDHDQRERLLAILHEEFASLAVRRPRIVENTGGL